MYNILTCCPLVLLLQVKIYFIRLYIPRNKNDIDTEKRKITPRTGPIQCRLSYYQRNVGLVVTYYINKKYKFMY